ncbi:MAG: shikimate dehydrogenase [Mariprofundaceae bacterium]
MELTGKTKIFGIIGNPVAHSLSPLFQAWFLERHQIDAVYVPFHVPDEGLADAMKGLWAAGVQGLNVTIPHKEAVLPWVKMDASAALIGAVNTLRNTPDGWLASNTDWQGVEAVLSASKSPIDQPVLMFGAGGTAKAVVHALCQRSVEKLYICNRNRDRAETLVTHIGQNYTGIDCEILAWDSKAVCDAATKCGTWINTTSIGLHQDDEFPFQLSGKAVAVDVVYKPNGDTAFCRMVRRQGLYALDGLLMLVAQGAASFSFWHNMAQPDIMAAFRWMEMRLERDPMVLTNWEDTV